MAHLFKFRYLHFIAVLLFSFMSISFVACSSDDDEEPTKGQTSGTNDFLVGKWKYQFSTGFVYYTFKADGTGSEVEYDEGYVDTDEFLYIHNPQECTIKFYDIEDEDWDVVSYVKVSETKLITFEDDHDEPEEWIKQ